MDRNALEKREKARESALGLPGAGEEFPRGEEAHVHAPALLLEGKGAPPAGPLRGRVGESRRAVVPGRLTAEPDAR
ncbi:hypothetical protein ACFY30_07225 [Streptomyces sp. NPDC000345]|uniref:hypothetical protein n=1 Tax=Streptomyces sp. NPDC000345 TaxID=3364537 RepID=UPI0036A79E32